jgi:glycosyltransferase involved in cell wall biosynthesis
MPAVSVVIPSFNRRQFVSQAVESALAQTFRDFEILVVDDGSEDGTADALSAQFGNSIRIERLPRNHGRSTARNVGWALARGEFVAFLDSDDLWLSEKLARQIPLFDRPEVTLVHSWVGAVDAEGEPLAAESAVLKREFAKALARGYGYSGITETWCRMYTSAVMMRTSSLRSTGGFDARLSNWEDWDVFWRAARLGEVATVPETLVLHRAHSGNTPDVWNLDAAPWIAVIRRHMAELDALPAHETPRGAYRNLRINMALGEYWRRNLPASRRWMWRALRRDPALLAKPWHSVWGAPLLHACLPHAAAARLVTRFKLDNYATTQQ